MSSRPGRISRWKADPAEPDPTRGIVFQRYSLFPHLTAIGNLVMGLELRRSRLLGRLFGASRRAALQKAQQMLESVGLGTARDRYPAQLSGGMQQRLAIAQAVICEPKICCWTSRSRADPGLTADMHQLILTLWAENRMTIS